MIVKWIARIALAALLCAGAYGLYVIPTARKGPSHLWPVHSHHVVFLFGMELVWVGVGIAAIAGLMLVVFFLWELALGRPWGDVVIRDKEGMG